LTLLYFYCSLIEEPQKTNKKTNHPKGTTKSRIWGTETPEPIATKLCRVPSRT